MVCKEEVFNWFKELSGAKRIELMCGLMSMCIPLEIRFFEAIIGDLAKKDFNALREAELKANSFQELDAICKCDLLADKTVIDSNELKPNTNCETIVSNVVTTNCSLNNSLTVQQPLQSSQVMPIQEMSQTMAVSVSAVSANGTTISLASNEMTGLAPSLMSSPPNSSNSSSNLSLLPSRSKLIVSLCLLSPTNRSCSTLAYKALRQQLTAKLIANAVLNCYYRKGCSNFDDLYSEILLLLTMALHHPAFSYEQRDILFKQKEEVQLTIEGINSHFRQSTANFTTNAHHFQQFHHQSHHPSHAAHHPPQAPTPASQVAQAGVSAQTHHLPQGVPTHQSSQQYPTHAHTAHTYIPVMPVSVPNLPYSPAPIQNMSNLRISSMSSPVSTPSPTNSPSSSSKATATSVATISPLPIAAEFGPHVIAQATDSAPNQASYVLTAGLPSIAHQTSVNVEDMGCAKTVVSCYNCGNSGHEETSVRLKLRTRPTDNSYYIFLLINYI